MTTLNFATFTVSKCTLEFEPPSSTHPSTHPHKYTHTHAQNIRCVSSISVLSTTTVTRFFGGCRFSVRWCYRVRCADKEDPLERRRIGRTRGPRKFYHPSWAGINHAVQWWSYGLKDWGRNLSRLRSIQTERGPQKSFLSNDHRLHFLWNKASQGITLNIYLI
jgi:hypothetical protein